MCYDDRMEKMLTVRLGKEQDVALTRRAKAIGKTRSAVVRDLIDTALADRPMSRRVGHLKGGVELRRSRSGWRRELTDRNWR